MKLNFWTPVPTVLSTPKLATQDFLKRLYFSRMENLKIMHV